MDDYALQHSALPQKHLSHIYLLSTVQIHHLTCLQVLRHLRLPHILLYIRGADPRLAQVSLRSLLLDSHGTLRRQRQPPPAAVAS